MDLKRYPALIRLGLWVALTLLGADLGPLPTVQAQQPAKAQAQQPTTTQAQQPAKSDPPVAASKPEDLDQPFVIRLNSNMVVTPVTVFDSGRQFVYDIDQNEFLVYDNGKQQKILQFGTELHPVDLVVVVETNDTTAPMLADIRGLGSMFSDMLVGPGGRAAIVTYSDHVDVLQPFTQNGDRFDTALRTLGGRGSGYHLDDAIGRAVSMLNTVSMQAENKEDRRVIVVFSDGFNIGSQMNKNEIVKRALNSDITIYGLGFKPIKGLWDRPQKDPPPDLTAMSMGYPSSPNMASTPFTQQQMYQAPVPIVPIILATGETVKSIVLKSSLEYFAGYSGGVYYAKWGKSDVQEALNRIATEIHGQYELAYVPDNLDESGFHHIEVKVRRPGAKVRARAGYYYMAIPKPNVP